MKARRTAEGWIVLTAPLPPEAESPLMVCVWAPEDAAVPVRVWEWAGVAVADPDPSAIVAVAVLVVPVTLCV